MNFLTTISSQQIRNFFEGWDVALAKKKQVNFGADPDHARDPGTFNENFTTARGELL